MGSIANIKKLKGSFKFNVTVEERVVKHPCWISLNFDNCYMHSVYLHQLPYFKSNWHLLFYSFSGCLYYNTTNNKFCENLK